MSEVVADVARRFNARRSGKGYIAKCPAHDDRKPSLSIDEGVDGRALVICRAGCALDVVLSAAGLTINDLFPAPTRQPSKNGARFDWKACVDAFTDDELERFADWRGYSGQFCSSLRNRKLIGLYKGCIALPMHDESGAILGAHVRAKTAAGFTRRRERKRERW